MSKQKEEIQVEIDADGKITIAGFGFEGRSCEQATADIEKLFGGVTERNRGEGKPLTDEPGERVRERKREEQ